MRQVSLRSGGLTLNLTVLTAGADSPCVLFLPGTGKYGQYYEPFLRRVQASGYSVAALDPRGHGRSGGKRGDFSIAELVENARDAITYCLAEISPRLALMGSSQGGIVALYALTEDDRPRTAILHNAAILNEPGVSAVNISKFSRRVRPLVPFLSRIVPWYRVPIRRYLEMWRIFDDIELGWRLERDPLVVQSYTLRTFRSLSSAAPARPVETIRTPTLVLAADRDLLFPVEYVRSVYDRLTCDRRFTVVPDAGHMLLVEHLDRTMPMVIEWLQAMFSEQ